MVKVCFVVDCTKSMISHWNFVVDEIEGIIRTGPLSTQYALVAYRDMTDDDDMLVKDFTVDGESILTTLWGIKPGGGIDIAEDVAGALREAARLDWETPSRLQVLIHFTDAPAHGYQYNGGLVSDRFQDGDPRGFDPLYYVTKLARLNINYDFYRMNDSTDIMTEQFANAYRGESASFCIIGKLDTSETSQEEELCNSIPPVCYCQTD